MHVRAFLVPCAFALPLFLTASPAAAKVGEHPPGAIVTPLGKGKCVVVPSPPRNTRADDVSKVWYVNRCAGGCSLLPGTNNAIDDHSEICDPPAGADCLLEEFHHGDEAWNWIVDCVRNVMRPYDISVVDADPGAVIHHETMVAGLNTQLGYGDASVLGVSGAGACASNDNHINFVFANSPYFMNGGETNLTYLCTTIVHEAGHNFGLDHIYDCKDPMTYFTGCGIKYFRDEMLSCASDATGPWEPATCSICPGAAQNTHLKLVTVFGEGVGAYPPEVEILGPTDGGNVDAGFVVHASASDARGIGHLDLHINGWKWDEVEGHEGSTPYVLRPPDNLPDGVLDIEVYAYNDLEVLVNASVSVMKGAPCANADSCLDGQTCEEGKCFWPPATIPLGGECVRLQDCTEGTCEEVDGLKLCSESCIPGIADQCMTEGLECFQSGVGVGFCWASSSGDGGGCCAVAEDREPPWLELGLFLGVMLLAVRRRRRQ